ncbi:MAG: sugar transferase [Candidatus Methylomirabilis sp.]|nr:sugar transferase [Candidatus Methylomirabilis sp.]
MSGLHPLVEELRPDRIVVALAERRGRLPVRDLLEMRVRGTVVVDGITSYEYLTGKLAIENLVPSYLIFSRDFERPVWRTATRRLVSIMGAAIGLVLSLPFMGIIAVLILLDSGRPALFIQKRVGLRGRVFSLLKFRTMRVKESAQAESVWERNDDSRVTRVGRWLRMLRLDEPPQFFNILKGDMDFIGPRPEIAGNVKSMTEKIPFYALRHVVRPGITGWAQIKYGYSVNQEDVTEKTRYDLYYIKHLSLSLDLRILIDTVKIVLFGRGAAAPTRIVPNCFPPPSRGTVYLLLSFPPGGGRSGWG